MADVIKTTFQVKRGTAARWEELNLILNPGEPGFEMDTFKLKIGNGSTPWKELPYLNDVDISKYSLKKLDTATTGMSASYQLTKDGIGIGAVIDIPKDMMVKSGSVQTYEAGSLPAGVTEAGTYIVLVLNDTAETKLYINVGDLIEYVTGATATDGIITTSVDANHVLTATIGDGTITKAKLAEAVKTSLGKADTALQAAALDPYAKTEDIAAGYVAKNGTDRLITAEEGAKLAGITAGAQVNTIDEVKINGTLLSVVDKSVNIPGASADNLGVVKGSSADNGVTINEDYSMTVNNISTDKLFAGSDTLVWNCGDAKL